MFNHLLMPPANYNMYIDLPAGPVSLRLVALQWLFDSQAPAYCDVNDLGNSSLYNASL